MTEPNRSDARNLISLAARLGIPADEAIRQVAQLIADPDNTLLDASVRAAPAAVAAPEARALVV